MANDEEVDDFGGLESSVTWAEDARAGLESNRCHRMALARTLWRLPRRLVKTLQWQLRRLMKTLQRRLLLRRWRDRVRGVGFKTLFL
jgi:hypothetical protein